MRKNLVFSILIVLAFWLKTTTVESSTKKAIRVDNDYIHTYKNRQGRWMIPSELPKSISMYIRELETSEDEVRNLNAFHDKGPLPAGKPIFFPFGEEYAKVLLSQGKGRDIVISDYRDFLWPVGTVNAKLSSKLGMRQNSMHTGIDIACPNRSPIVAAGDGKVTIAGNNGNYGLFIEIEHEVNQLHTIYAHNSVLLVKEGDKVAKGQIIALSGSTGHSTGPHLHFEVRYQNIVLNPEHYIHIPGTSSPLKLAFLKE